MAEPRPPMSGAMGGARSVRLAAAWFLLALLAVGSLALWLGVPALSLLIASRLTESSSMHLPLALGVMIPGMFAAGLLLSWLNLLYLRVTGGEIVGTGSFRARRKGPLEPLMVVSFAIAVICLFIWFFAFAENPSWGVF